MQTVLVTGGCGFIGSHTSYLLLKKGYKVIILDSNINSSEKVIGKIKLLLANDKIYNPKLEFVKGDLRDEELLENIFKMAVLNCQPICFVMHFAGLKSVSESISNPIKYWDTNVVSSIKLFKYMDLYKCRNIVFSSSATIYKINQSSLIKEDDPIGPSNPYGQTKFLIESILDDIFANSRLWKIANLRY